MNRLSWQRIMSTIRQPDWSPHGRRSVQGARRPHAKAHPRLLRSADLTAGELADHFDMTKPSISHHLNTLKAAGLVDAEREGQSIVYSLNTSVLQDLMSWFYTFTNRSDSDDE